MRNTSECADFLLYTVSDVSVNRQSVNIRIIDRMSKCTMPFKPCHKYPQCSHRCKIVLRVVDDCPTHDQPMFSYVRICDSTVVRQFCETGCESNRVDTSLCRCAQTLTKR